MLAMLERRNLRAHGRRSPRASLALVAIVVLVSAAPTLAQDRERVLEWIAPAGAVDGYTVHLGQGSRSYNETIDTGFVAADGDGVTRTTLILDASLNYYVAVKARNQFGESGFSNELMIPASTCNPAACDDGDPCTADDCNASGCVNTVVSDGTICGAGGEVCQAGACMLPTCDDGNLCNGTESWVNGSCRAGVPLDCGASTQCADPTCDPAGGCGLVARPNGSACNDGNPDTVQDQCQSGFCSGTFVAPLATCETGDGCPQDRKQVSCINMVGRTLQSIARMQSNVIFSCLRRKASRGESLEACLALPSRMLDRARSRTGQSFERFCSEPAPDFGIATASHTNNAAVASELASLADLLGASPDTVLVSSSVDRDAARCQSMVLRHAERCKMAWHNEFRRCMATGLRRGEIASEAALEACFGQDPYGRIARACDPDQSPLATNVLTRSCVERGVDLSDTFPGCGSDDPREVAAEIDAMAECRVCRALNDGHGLALDCGTCP